MKVSSIGLGEYDHLELEQHPGQVFYNAADIRFVGSNGETLLRLKGVKDAGAFKNAIESMSTSRRLVQNSMNCIEARN